MIALIRLLLFAFLTGRAEESRVFGDNFEHVNFKSAQDVSSLLEKHSSPNVNLHFDDKLEAFHSVAIENQYFVITGFDHQKSILATSSDSIQHLFQQANSTLQLHNLWISLTGTSTILSYLHWSSLLIAQTTIESPGTNNLFASGVVPSFVRVDKQPDSASGTDIDLSINILSQSFHSVKLIPQCGIFVSSSPPSTERWSDLSTSVFSSGCRFTNISSAQTTSSNMPHHSRTRYTQIVSNMDMTESEHGMYGLVSSDINSGGDFLFKNTSFSHCTTTETGKAFVQGDQSSYSSVTEFDTCTFTLMTSTTPGAAVYRYFANALTLTSCTFTKCESTVSSGQHGGALCAYACNTVELAGTNTFDGCACRGGSGGGFAIMGTASPRVVSGVKCEDCSNSDETDEKGTAYFGYGEEDIWQSFTECEGNGRAPGGGGLNVILTGTHTLSYSSFTNCSHLTHVGGGVVFPTKSSIIMDTVSFTSCHTLDAQAGGCYLGSESSVEVKDCSFTDCNNSLNNAFSGGGALFTILCPKVHIDNTHFFRCKTLKGTENISMGGGFYDASGEDTRLHLCSFTDCVGGLFGGGASLRSSVSVITNCTFTNCFCKSGGGLDISYGQSTVEYCVFNKCSTAKVDNQGVGGGGMYSSKITRRG
ncbi:hypothetical protein BLNAU_17987 [Blattamonas nauphoetae]|uniref:Uncharacterized protein n=1 Tax=Blattamonas nauphoetae TaxID=2049346 RepID=A0ABQ9X6X2_9EUKA|nr:hypothetical protein BLNAU_17987 [Blattamonas nauphoetae]